MDLAQISHECGRAIADADAHGAAEAAVFLRTRAAELIRAIRVPPVSDCAHCEYHPHPLPASRVHA